MAGLARHGRAGRAWPGWPGMAGMAGMAWQGCMAGMASSRSTVVDQAIWHTLICYRLVKTGSHGCSQAFGTGLAAKDLTQMQQVIRLQVRERGILLP